MTNNTDSMIRSLEKVRYPKIQQCNFLQLSITDFSEIISWLSRRLSFFAKTDSIIQPLSDEGDEMSLPSLKLELNSLLKELGSIHSDKLLLDTPQQRRKIIKSLIGDLYASQIKYLGTDDEDFSLEMNPRKDIENIANSLSMPQNFLNVIDFFQKVNTKVKQNLPRFDVEGSLFTNCQFQEKEWNDLKAVNATLNQEYSIRREMLLRRLDTTIASFTWKANDDYNKDYKIMRIKELYTSIRKPLTATPRVSLSHALAARSSDFNKLLNERISTTHESCLIVAPNLQKLANQGAQQRTELHKFLIGNVPDRGGRTEEHSAPKREQNFYRPPQHQQQYQQQQHRGQRNNFRGNQQRNNNWKRNKRTRDNEGRDYYRP